MSDGSNKLKKFSDGMDKYLEKTIITIGRVFIGLLAIMTSSLPSFIEEIVNCIFTEIGTSDIYSFIDVNTLISSATYVVFIIIFVFIARKYNIAKLSFNFINKKNILIVIGGFVLYRIVVIVGYILLHIQGIESTANDTAIQELFENQSIVLMFITMSLYAPIVEELVFRAFLMGTLFKNYKAVVGILVSSTLFGIFHGPADIVSFLIYFGGGLIFAITYYKTKRIEVTMCIHFINNLLAWVFTYIQ
ncbi:CPBP family intramembrane glutamic endopeptidase [Peptostreptococcus faecalis]|uniref:CPBP family intramembrane glutamic endopeptidase n=1 Tax=Peptostreptococcus faecalis TaxID=2045015 RepID=UPI000C7D4696|nr:CPBP family intramembrane glutamic endopeptidase [Peptostreptococcus faecalis]